MHIQIGHRVHSKRGASREGYENILHTAKGCGMKSVLPRGDGGVGSRSVRGDLRQVGCCLELAPIARALHPSMALDVDLFFQ